jgi:DNA replication protein DnaC
VTRQAHAAPRPVAGPLEGVLARLRRRLEIVPDGTLEPEPEDYLESAWLRLCPPRFRDTTPANLDPILRQDVAAWRGRLDIDPARAGNLILLGNVGVGKTWAALALARAALPHMSVRFVSVPALLESLRPDGGGHLGWYTRVGLLVLDDLGAERLTDWSAEQLYQIVNERWAHERPIIATSNLNPAQVAAAVGARTWDRLRDGATAIAIAGESRRRPREEGV